MRTVVHSHAVAASTDRAREVKNGRGKVFFYVYTYLYTVFAVGR